MSNDYFTETTVTGWGERLGQSCFGMILGLLLFFASFFVLFWNEGRTDFSAVAQNAIEISINTTDSKSVGKFVSVSGSLTTNQTLGDGIWLKPGNYIAAQRQVEMYAWKQDERTETHKNVGGSETKTTTYIYNKEWQINPPQSSSFRYAQGHENPPMLVNGEVFRVTEAKIGIYDINPANVELPELNHLRLNTNNINQTQGFFLANNYLFKGTGSLKNPALGDLRLSYSILENQANVTLFGKLDNSNHIEPYLIGNETFYRLFRGDRASAIAKMKQEYKLWTWIFRGVGFLMMWIGLSLEFGLVTTFLDVLPFLGNIAEGITGTGSFLVALVLSTVTILVSSLLHNIVALLIAIAIGITVILFFRNLRRSN